MRAAFVFWHACQEAALCERRPSSFLPDYPQRGLGSASAHVHQRRRGTGPSLHSAVSKTQSAHSLLHAVIWFRSESAPQLSKESSSRPRGTLQRALGDREGASRHIHGPLVRATPEKESDT